MAVGIIMEFDGFPEEMYEAVRAKINWPHELPDGFILHLGGPTESGLRVVEGMGLA